MERKPDYHVGSKTASNGEGHAPDSKGDEEVLELSLGPLRRHHLDGYAEWRNQDRIRHCCREYSLLTMVNQEDWFESVSRDRTNEMFEICVVNYPYSGMPCGVCGLTHINWKDRHAEVSIYIGDPEYEGRGVGTWTLGRLAEIAFAEYALQRLWAEIYEFNLSSIRLFEKCGYKREGRIRQTVWWDNQGWDSFIYGLLRGEWTCAAPLR